MRKRESLQPRDRGATGVEYGLIVGLVAVVLIVAIALVGTRLSGAFTSANCPLSSGSDCGASSSGTPTPSASLLAAADWCPPPTGTAIACRAVDKLNNLPWTKSDVTLSTTAALTGTNWNQATGTGSNGYGLWLRATQTSGFGVTSGYTFQVDPGAGNRFVVKVWNTTGTGASMNRTETTLGMASFPPGFDPTASNRVSVSLVGNNLNATVNGSSVFSNFNVQTATVSKGKVPPVGTSYGVRTWGQAGMNMDSTTVQ